MRRFARQSVPAGLASLALLAACAAAPRGRAAAPPRAAGTVYTCGDGARFAVRYDAPGAGTSGAPPAGLTLRLAEAAGDRELRLAVDTAVGTAAAGPGSPRYRGRDAAGDVTFAAAGDEATLAGTTSAGATLPARRCRAQAVASAWDEARLLGAEYRAVGQEPGWSVDVDEGRRIQFVGDYGGTRVAVPAPPPATETAAGAGGAPGANRVTYSARTEAHTLVLDVVRQACRDVMSGEQYPTTAVVRLDGREYRGCGRWLGAAPRN